jgi:hypothetical protein
MHIQMKPNSNARRRGFAVILSLLTLTAIGVAIWSAWDLGNSQAGRNETIEQGLEAAK